MRYSSAKRGYVLTSVIVLGGALLALSAMSFRHAYMLAEDNMITAERLRMENALAQCAAISEAWFRAHSGRIAPQKSFSLDAQAETSPKIYLPDALFAMLAREYENYEFNCVTIDLHYDDCFAQEALSLRVPQVSPKKTKSGGVERAYMQKITVTRRDNKYISVAMTKSLRVIKEPTGKTKCVSVGVRYSE